MAIINETFFEASRLDKATRPDVIVVVLIVVVVDVAIVEIDVPSVVATVLGTTPIVVQRNDKRSMVSKFTDKNQCHTLQKKSKRIID